MPPSPRVRSTRYVSLISRPCIVDREPVIRCEASKLPPRGRELHSRSWWFPHPIRLPSTAMGRVLIVYPPVTIARDWIDYPYFADLGAVQLAASLRASHEVSLVDAYALESSTLYWR